MTHETPTQRRTRLIEEYVKIYTGTPHQRRLCAQDLAAEVIAATPQEPPQERPDLQAYIDRCEYAIRSTGLEPRPPTALKNDLSDEQLAKLLKGQATERYPSEIETRLIELCEQIINETVPLSPEGTPPYHERLAAIKRELGGK